MDILMQFLSGPWARVSLLVPVLLSFGIYSGLNKTANPKGMNLMTRFDHKIPFLPAFSVPYLLHFPYVLFVLLVGILHSPYFAQIAAGTIAIQLASALIFRWRQSHVPRPAVEGKGVFPRLVRMIYRLDRPYCTFPSQHVAYSVICAYWSTLILPGLASYFMILTSAIVASTLFLKQHALADVAGGLSLAAVCAYVIG